MLPNQARFWEDNLKKACIKDFDQLSSSYLKDQVIDPMAAIGFRQNLEK